MKTLIALSATNVFLGFTSFVLSTHVYDSVSSPTVVHAKAPVKVKASVCIQSDRVVFKPEKEFIKPVKIKRKTFVTRVKIKLPVVMKTLVGSPHNLKMDLEPDPVAGTNNELALQKETGLDDYNYMQLMDKAEKLEEYAKQKGYSTEYGFLINMGMKSGKKRFFVIDLSSMVILDRGMVSHGRGRSGLTPDRTYSNEPGSNCTSLGIYEVGKSDTSTCNTSYKLYGLEESNSNAYKRSIQLQAMNTIPEDEMERPIFQSNGSPAISTAFLNEVSSIINKDSKPVLMWIFDTERESELLSCRY